MKRLAVGIAIMSVLCEAAGAAPLAANAAVVLVNGAPLYEETNKVLKALEYLTLGDIVTLLSKTGVFKESGRDRDFTRIRAFSGKEGWVRTQYIATKAGLAIVKAEEASIYSEPRVVKLTDKHISAMTLVAVLQEGSSSSYAKVQGYDTAQKMLFTDSTYVSVDDLTASEADVNAAILYDVALATRDATVKKNLLKVALMKYGSTMFLDKIQAALGASP
jgi:hypothetical protein